MGKKIMLAVDDSVHSKHTVAYAARISSAVKVLHIVLFHVQPMISLFLQDEARKSMKANAELEKVRKSNDEKAHRLLNGYKDEMVQMGIDADCIERVTLPRKLGLAKDIINFAQERRYDAIVVGRRGLSHLQEKIMGSVTAELVEHSKVIPVWVIDGKVTSNKILIAVDGSEYSLRAVDHVSFIVGDNEDTYLTFFHIKASGADFSKIEFDAEKSGELEKIIARGNQKFVDEFHARAMQKLKDAGIGEDRFEIRVAERVKNVGKAILDKTSKEDFGTIVIGRSGISKSFFMGSVSRYVIKRATDCALWIVS
jgi:nucleotide-binding universal stress UspA family protein